MPPAQAHLPRLKPTIPSYSQSPVGIRMAMPRPEDCQIARALCQEGVQRPTCPRKRPPSAAARPEGQRATCRQAPEHERTLEGGRSSGTRGGCGRLRTGDVRAWRLVAFAALVAAGCHSRSVVQIHDPSEQEVVLIETLERTNYLVSATSEHVFWECTERQDSLVCERQCGDGTQYRCPSDFRLHHASATEAH